MEEQQDTAAPGPLGRLTRALREMPPLEASGLMALMCGGATAALALGLWLVSGDLAGLALVALSTLTVAAVTFWLSRSARAALEEADLARRMLVQQAEHDELTGLKNRKGFFQLGKIEILRSRRLRRPFSVAFLDIDALRKVNDGYGRDAGDKVIRELSDLLKSHMREYDVGARFGGEEFVILLPETDHRSGARVVGRFLEAIRKHKFEVGKGKAFVTVSGGLATYSETRSPAETLPNIVQRAMAGLRKAKERGGDRCCVGPLSTDALVDLPVPREMQADDSSEVGGRHLTS